MLNSPLWLTDNRYNCGYGNRWAEEHEMIGATEKIKCDEDAFCAAGVPVVSDGLQMHVVNDDSHSLIIGATGSMKTRRVIMPAIATLIKRGESMILNDVKGELYKRFYKALEGNGYKVAVLNFRDTYKGNRWNPLSIAYKHYWAGRPDKSSQYIRDVADCLFNYNGDGMHDDPYWENSAKDYFCGWASMLIKEAPENALTLENIRINHSYGDEKYGKSRYINEYCNMIEGHSDISMYMSGSINAPNDTRASIYSVFSQPLSLFLQENLRDMLCRSDFDISKLGMEKTAIFIISPDESSACYPVISLFLKQCYSSLVDAAHSQENADALPIRVNFVIDEFSSLPKIPDFVNMISAARSRNIRFHLVVQNLLQLQKSYSKEISDTIMTNCGLWIILRSKDNALHELVSKMCGEHIGEFTHEKRLLVDAMTIQCLNKARGECLVLMDGQHPFITELPDIDAYSFNLPVTNGVVFQTRCPIKRSLWDIRKRVPGTGQSNLHSTPLPAAMDKMLLDLIIKYDEPVNTVKSIETSEEESNESDDLDAKFDIIFSQASSQGSQ